MSGNRSLLPLLAAVKENRLIQIILISILLTILILITYSGVFKNEFVDWDDFGYVVNNDLVRNPGNSYLHQLFTTPVSSNYHPLTILTMRMNNNTCPACPNGISPAPFIMWNVILHIMNTILVLILVYLLTGRNILVAAITALIFGLHPMHVESVAWISERKDVLYSFFFLSGLLGYLKFLENGRRKILWLILTFILFILSCLSKAMAVVFPLVLILINFMVYPPQGEKPVMNALKNAVSLKSLLWLVPFFIVSFLVGLMALRIQSGENFLGLLDLTKNAPDVVNKIGPFSFFQRVEIACYGFIVYIIKFFIPAGLSAIHSFPPVSDFSRGSFAARLILSVISVIIIAILIIRSLSRTRIYAFSAGFYFVTLVLVLQFITVGISLTSERYTYLPYIGLSMIPAMIVSNSRKTTRTILLIITGCFIIMFIVVSKMQIPVWRNTESLWSAVIRKYPNEEVPRRSRGKYYSRKLLMAKNETERKILEDKVLIDFTEAIRAHTTSADVYMGTGIIYGTRGDLKNALTLLNSAIALDPKKGSAYYNRALVNDQLNRKEEAISDYNMALILKPDMAIKILNNRSGLFLETGRFREAILDFDFLISRENNNFYYYSNRGVARQQTGDIEGAVSDYKKALQLKPDDRNVKELLNKVLQQKK